MSTIFLYVAALIVCAIVISRFLRAQTSASTSPSDEGPDGDLVFLASSPNAIVIDAYRGALESVGIPVVVFDEATSRMLGRAPAVAMRLMVPEARLAEAQSVLRDLEAGALREPDGR